mgnify:CR=1 FL=1
MEQRFAPVIENAAAKGRVVLVCEHASNAFPAPWGDLGLSEAEQRAHIAWDPGALGVARGLMARLDAVLVHAPVSRLIYDCNRAPDMPGAMPARSEVYDVPGNIAVQPEMRWARTESIYLPFHDALHGLLMQRVALGLRPVLVTVHSFTPVYFGRQRAVEFGVIHDADPALAMAIRDAAARQTRLNAQLNAPYSAEDDVTHTLRVHATPYGLPNAMLEIRNDLIADAAAQDAMAAQLAPVINMGVAEIQKQAKAS